MAAYNIPTMNFDMNMEFESWTMGGVPLAESCTRPQATRAHILCGVGTGTQCYQDTVDPRASIDSSLDYDGYQLHGDFTFQDTKTHDVTFSPFEMDLSRGLYRHDSPRSEGSSQSGDSFSASCYTDDLSTHVPHQRPSMNNDGIMQAPYFMSTYPAAATQSPLLPPGLGGGITLGEVQNFEDQVAEFQDSAYSEPDAEGESDHEVVTADEQERPMKRSPRQEKIHRPSVAESVQDSMSEDFEPDEEDDGDYTPRRASTTRGRRNGAGRRASQGRRMSNGTSSGRVAKPKTRKPSNANLVRPFPCPLAQYGCASTFISKNEWKRHVSTQHIKLGFWRCDMCSSGDPQNPSHNDFNRKDLFTQHLRRMHRNDPLTSSTYINDAGETEISDEAMLKHQTRCYLVLRQNPSDSTCLFTQCKKTFHGDDSWDERMEHVGTHMEKDRKAGKDVVSCDKWHEDTSLRDYLEHEGLIEYENGRWGLGDGIPKRESVF